MSVLPFPEPLLSDGVVALRLWRDEDVPVKASWGLDPEIVRWTGVPAGYTEDAARVQAARVEQARREGRMIGLAIVDAGTGAVLGSCDLRRPDSTDPALGEVGYLLASEARGRGAAARAVWLLVDWSFRELAMERVQALVHPVNPPSAAVLERLGFQREGLLRGYRAVNGGREDRVLYAVLRGGLLCPAPIPPA